MQHYKGFQPVQFTYQFSYPGGDITRSRENELKELVERFIFGELLFYVYHKGVGGRTRQTCGYFCR